METILWHSQTKYIVQKKHAEFKGSSSYSGKWTKITTFLKWFVRCVLEREMKLYNIKTNFNNVFMLLEYL